MKMPATTFGFILYFVRRQSLRFLILILAFVLWAICDAIFPYFLKRIINVVQFWKGDPAGIYAAVATPVLLLVFFWVLAEIAMRVQGILQIYTFPRFRANIREAVFDYVKSHSHAFFSSQFSGSIAKRLADLPKSCQSIMEIVCLQFTTAFTGAVIVFIMMWYTQPIFALILTIWLALHMVINLVFLRYGSELAEVHSESQSTLSGKMVDVFTNILNMRLFARGDYEADYLKFYQKDEIRKAKKSLWLAEMMRIGLGLNGLFLIFGLLYALLYGWAHGWVSLGDFTQIEMQAFWLLGWMWYVTFQLTTFVREVGVTGDALALVRKSHDLTDKKNAYPIRIGRGEIRFDNVTFGYQKNRPIFQDLNIVISPGEKVGLVGYSGSGKTTFVNLILRFYDLQAGRILIDGQDIADVTQDSLRAQIAMIPQDPSLFNRSLLENIRYGRLNATDEEVIEASTMAHCHEFVEKLDGKYQSLVGERGLKLSGGQRQRIAIARAVLKNAPILMLDEATSALDSVTERLIQDSLHHLMQGRTAIVVAHRLSTLADMDRILVFHKGKVIEEGTHEQLLELGGYFATLWNMQTDGFLPGGDGDEEEEEETSEDES
ncbi:MAG: ABC transporter ATP-binding protein [Gammaproteobacteria bacterium]|nr:ABC transporter ATP-binding protein [Gammaproteobacteria bacterium]